MFETLKIAATEWNQAHDDRIKLQHAYVVLLIAVVFLSGLVSMLDISGARQLLFIAGAILTALVVNFITWSLLKTTLLDKLPKRATRRR